MFDKMNPPFYSMEQGVLLEILDSVMQVESMLKADTAYYMNKTKEKQILVGHGFESNTSLTEYTIRKTEGVFPITESE